MTIAVDYDDAKKVAVLTFPNGRCMRLSNVTKEHAEKFAERHGPEFQRRDCVLHSMGALETRAEK
jgi:hypothetical protein